MLRLEFRWGRRLGVAVALIGALSLAATAAAHTSPIGAGSISPSTLPKKRFAPVSLHLLVKLITDDADGIPAPLTNLKLDFDDDGRITTTGLATCDPAQLENTTTATALSLCGPAQVGTGLAQVRVPVGDSFQQYPATLTAFNGLVQGGKPTLVVHARSDDLGVTQVLVGTIRDSKAGKDFGKALSIPFPPLPAGAVVSSFEMTIDRTWTAGGKQASYLSARCHDRNRTLNVKGTPALAGFPRNLVGEFSQRCRVKR
jgi:hypothetical protein